MLDRRTNQDGTHEFFFTFLGENYSFTSISTDEIEAKNELKQFIKRKVFQHRKDELELLKLLLSLV